MHFVIAIAAILLILGLLADGRRRRAMKRLRLGGTVSDTPCGPVEFAQLGSGPAVLLLHGGVGGWDQAAWIAVSLLSQDGCAGHGAALREGDALLRDRIAVIAPSRLGYLRTPLSSGRTPADGADAMAALLDALGIDRVLVVGISGGGGAALQFALRHLNRTAALVQAAAISRRHVQPARTTDSLVGQARELS